MMDVDSREINKKIQLMITAPDIDNDTVIRFVKGECQTVPLTPQTLGMLFEMYAQVETDENSPLYGFSRIVTIAELCRIHPAFQSTNGNQWARSYNSYLGKKYLIKREHSGGRVSSVQLDGPNYNSIKRFRHIRPDIYNEIVSRRCVVLDISTNIECDHKNGLYNTLSNIDLADQRLEDFQPMSKAVNMAKKQHCTECIASGKRYDARRLGYKEGWIVGDENTSVCMGCYWFDPLRFNELISKDYNKTS